MREHSIARRSSTKMTTRKKSPKPTSASSTSAHVYKRPIVTQVVPFHGFYAAEGYHQHYLDHHMDQPYIVYNDLPKLAALRKEFAGMCKR